MRWVSLTSLCYALCAGFAQAQGAASAMPDWQKAAGGKMSFEVASIRVTEPGKFTPPSFALSPDNWFRDPQGSFHSDFGVGTYITFAYKEMLTGEQTKALLPGLPDWVKTDHFTIQAKAPVGATKDQYRLMMQSLLADRFKLKVHFEDKEVPVLAMVLIKPGKPGPNLTPHDQGPSCDAKPPKETFPVDCYAIAARPENGLVLMGSRDQPMALIAKIMGNTGDLMDETGRPVVDETGLTGNWDFKITFAPAKGKGFGAMPGMNTEGPSVLEAIQEQLGVKLKPSRATISTMVIDHIERPSDN